MTIALRPRKSATVEPAPAPDLVEHGIHRDPSNPDPIATGTFTQRLVHRASAILSGRRSSRRSFLTRTAVVGSALAVGPLDFILKPGTAYGYLCGTCSDGWTAFCCTINGGRNVCPSGSFIAGWWKADNAAYCCGSARYIIDCNATCPTQCGCRCSGAGCDGRRTCCNQFRYGQCHTEISCYGPVVCRVATCTVPWRYDPSCTTTSRTDNRTTEHGAPCLGTDCGSPITRKYRAMGGASSVLGAQIQGEHGVGDGRGRRARYRNGNIYWTSTTGAREVHGSIFREYDRQGGPTAQFRYPTSDTRTDARRRTRYSNFEGGRIYSFISNASTIALPNPFWVKHEFLQGVGGVLGYPTTNVRSASDGRSTYVNFENGRIYRWNGNLVVEIHGSIFRWHEARNGVHGEWGYPLSDLEAIGDGRGSAQWFEGGILWHTSRHGGHGISGAVLDRYVANGAHRGYAGYPTRGTSPVGDGRGTYATFENKAIIYASPEHGGHQVHGAVLDYYRSRGGPTGSLGYPTSELGAPGGAHRYQSFEGGRIEYRSGRVTPA